jgi:hypothetical protein
MSKNVLKLILETCEGVGERANWLLLNNDGAWTPTRPGALTCITDLYDMAQLIGEGVTDLGILLCPPLDFAPTKPYD